MDTRVRSTTAGWPSSSNSATMRSCWQITVMVNVTGYPARSPTATPCSTTLPAISTTAVSNSIRSVSLTSNAWSHTAAITACTAARLSSTAGSVTLARTGGAWCVMPSSVTEHALGRLVHREHAVEVRELQHRLHLRVGAREPEIAAGLAGALEA